MASSPWELFSLYELKQLVRQKEDPRFANILSRIRLGEHTTKDVTLLKDLENNSNVSEGSISIFLTNVLKDLYNENQLNLLSSEVFTIKAKDTRRDIYTKQVPVQVTSINPHETGRLEAEIKVALNARYMQTKMLIQKMDLSMEQQEP